MIVVGEVLSDAEQICLSSLDGATQITLSNQRLKHACADATLDVQILAVEPVAVPVPAAGEPAIGVLARVVRAIQGLGALILIRSVHNTFPIERIAMSEGVRLFAIDEPPAEALWDAMLALGQPVYGVRGRCRVDAMLAHPASVLSSLAFGMFVCEEGLTLDELHEDRHGVRWRVAGDDLTSTVLARGGFAISRNAGGSGAYQDRGNEGSVRVVVESADGRRRLTTQPRLIAARPQGGAGAG